MKKSRKFIQKNWYFAAAAILGIAAFLCIFGIEPLRFTGIGWTLHGYDNADITQHQTGWMFFRNSPWSFPLGKALFLGYPEGTSVTYTDSIPIAAILFKLLSPILPEKFQYFGIYTCFCFIMQGILAAALLHHFTNDNLYASISCLLFIFSSAFLERCFRHTALSSHWLILAGLLIYFCRKKNPEKHSYLFFWCILLCISLGIHPYLFARILHYLLFPNQKHVQMVAHC